MKIGFEGILPAGVLVTIDGQRYHSSGPVPHIKRDGGQIDLNGWTTDCAECGKKFDLATAPSAVFSPTRRCPSHRKPGQRIGEKVEAR